MNKGFYSRLAITNIRKNKSIYLPYLLASTLIVGLFYILNSITYMVVNSEMAGGGSLGFILMLSSWICGLISLIILFYINSFVMKRRKKEFGLYSILGLGKRHISLVMVWEVLITSIISIVCGIGGGALLSQLLFLVLLKMVAIPAALTFQVPFSSVSATAALFAAGFAIVLVYDIFSVCRTDPIALLHSANTGEREPKARWLSALLGLAALGTGYALALAVQTPSSALGVFFPAVLLVIIGTYLLFLAGSIVLLKLLRKKKSFYYKPENFISVSGMIYRMKQNATGLSNICILSTCVLVTLSSTVCLFIGEEEILRSRYSRDYFISAVWEDNLPERVEDTLQAQAERYGQELVNQRAYPYLAYSAIVQDTMEISANRAVPGDYGTVTCLPLEDYRRITGADVPDLNPGEALAYATWTDSVESLRLEQGAFTVVGRIERPGFISDLGTLRDTVFVVPAFDDVLELQAECAGLGNPYPPSVNYKYQFDVAGDKEGEEAFYHSLEVILPQNVPTLRMLTSIGEARESFYQLYGGLLFVGIFFIALFLIATVLIIYYKQITEGFDDHDRFQIMEKVGMSDKEVRRTIQKQILMIFFLPLGMAVVHISVAFPVLLKLLTVFSMTNTLLFFTCTLAAILVFAALYYIVYQITGKTYYKIVQGSGHI